MTAEGPWEIPPLDDAPDIARDTGAQPGEALADTRNWAGFALLLIGALIGIGAVGAAGWGLSPVAMVGSIIACAALAAGAALILLESRRRRTRYAPPSDGPPPAWQAYVPPNA
ncbi:hypothetical protein [Nocardia sp. NPDC052566]|uniref:hypothetical protein n=1 Tax=Nocardia sp. NPDC052566 TaxID=3364330 RepID=UPI0037C9881F